MSSLRTLPLWLAMLIITPAGADQGGDTWLSQLATAVGERTVVQLGESGHGVAEFYTTKTAIVRHLHEHHGFDLLAVEGGVAECWLANRNMREWSAQRLMRNCFWDTWSGAEAEALFAYLQSRSDAKRPLRLVGFDNLPTSKEFAGWLEAATEQDPEAIPPSLHEAEAAFSKLMSGAVNERAEIISLHERAVAGFRASDELDQELALIVRNRLATLDFDPATLSRETISQMRERLMADLLLAHLQNNPDTRVMVWAHNAHIAHAYSRHVGGYTRQGEMVHEELGSDSLYTVGIFSGTGRAFAWFSGEDYELSEPAEDSLEGRLLARPGDVVFADLATEKAAGNLWVTEKITSFEWGQWPQEIIPMDMYDGVLVVREVSPLSRQTM